MKRFAVILVAFLAAVLVQAEDVMLKQWKSNFYLFTLNKDSVKMTAAENGCTLTVVADPGKTLGDVNAQWGALYTKGLTAGAVYRAEFTVKSSVDAAIRAMIMETGKPWSHYASKNITLKADEPQTVVVEYTAKADVKSALRAPGFYLGKVPVGATLTVTDVKLIEVK